MDELRKRQKIISQLVEARLEQGISQAELARRLGIQRSGINRLESGTQNPTLDMILKIASALGKDVSLELNDKEEPMSHVYSLRMYDTELMRFSMEKQGLSGLVAEILYTNEEQAHLLPLDMERTGEGVIHWLERRVIPKKPRLCGRDFENPWPQPQRHQGNHRRVQGAVAERQLLGGAGRI